MNELTLARNLTNVVIVTNASVKLAVGSCMRDSIKRLNLTNVLNVINGLFRREIGKVI